MKKIWLSIILLLALGAVSVAAEKEPPKGHGGMHKM